ncbi:hypothetical protein SAMN05216272_11048 [Pseudomonas panipatensis]|uniref:Uncharacterized protein n=2 Tax=Pseudomonas panipatensis TaxID=428992 RepID=A0A1G8L0N7_9PSED|nr:hypothetical protein SAMN05216272_11048 [Pseudomonas panipatensis]SMP72964.1 hypothetical protein SAMN06295951_111122 [Pseudomonas panipatensis]
MSGGDSEVSMSTGNTLRVSGCPPDEPRSRGDSVAASPPTEPPGQNAPLAAPEGNAEPIDRWLRRVAVLKTNWRRMLKERQLKRRVRVRKIAEAVGKGYAMTREEANRMASKLFDRD